ncbi:MAG: tetratricopeptide repeat protein [Nostocaceae cyanobacterium]|nr:tetratricopeptide repeat protein [Nostocaceae cyanobacterium]
MATIAEALQLAAQHHRANRFTQAEQIYRKILETQPHHADAIHGLGAIAQHFNQYQVAEKLFNTALQIQPKAAKSWFSLGNLHQTQGQLQEAAECYQKVLALQPKSFVVYNNLGYTFQLQENWEKAIACYQKALQLQPNFTEAKVNLANILHSQGKLPPEQKSAFATVNNDLGVTQKKQGNFKTATNYYRQAISLQPDLAIAHYNLGGALQNQGKLEDAIASYQKVIEINPQDPEIYKQLAENKLNQIYKTQEKSKKSSNKKLKIAFVGQPFVMTSYPNPMDSIGILTYELVNLLSQDCDVSVYTAGQKFQEFSHQGVNYQYIPVDFDKSLLQSLENFSEIKNIQKPIFSSHWYYLGYILQIANDLRKKQYDVVHIHNLSQFIPVIRALNPKIKIVLHMHCEWLNQLDQEMLAARLKHVDAIISPSEYISTQIRQRFPQIAERCHTIYNGVNFDRFIDTSVNKKQSKSTSVKNLLFVGRICPEKGSHILLEAFKKVQEQYPETQLNLVGPVGIIPYEYLVALSDDQLVANLASFHHEGNWISYLRKQVFQFQQEGETANPVSLAGVIPPVKLSDYYQQADIFIFPSICHEAFGMPIAEAMIAGVPVIATQAGAFPELIEDGKTGMLVERSDADALAAAIIQLLDNEKLQKSMVTVARKRAVELFSFEKMADDLLARYETLCNREIPEVKSDLSVVKTQ